MHTRPPKTDDVSGRLGRRPLNQRLSKVAIQWLEPEAPDSAVRWGFFDSVFEQREYGEAYVLEKLARENMAKDPNLKAEFERRIQADPRFAASPRHDWSSSMTARPGAWPTAWGDIPSGGCSRSTVCPWSSTRAASEENPVASSHSLAVTWQ